MIQVYLLTPEQAESLIGVEFMPNNFFNPIQDADGNWIISQEEVNQSNIKWVKQLSMIDFNPIINPGPY
jgi:hypothetical protein